MFDTKINDLAWSARVSIAINRVCSRHLSMARSMRHGRRFRAHAAASYPGLKLTIRHMGVPRASKRKAACKSMAHAKVCRCAGSRAAPEHRRQGGRSDAPCRRCLSIPEHISAFVSALRSLRSATMFGGGCVSRLAGSRRRCVPRFIKELPSLTGRSRSRPDRLAIAVSVSLVMTLAVGVRAGSPALAVQQWPG